VNTEVLHEFSYELTTSLSAWFGESVEIEWGQYEKRKNDPIDEFLPLLVAWMENDTLDNDLSIDTAGWLELVRSPEDTSTLSALVKLLARSRLSRPLQRYLYESAEIPIRWTLTQCPASRTLKRVPWKKVFFQKQPLLGRTRDLRAELSRPPSPLRPLTREQGEAQVRHIREVLGVRVRELFPLIHSSPDEVYLYEPGRGVQLVVLGNEMDIRLPIESNLGVMLVRNGMPVGYGIGAMLFDRAETAINMFPAYRGGESPFIIQELFRLLHQHFGAKTLLVRSYQVGDDNEEALESGSFWFYYKLGFRAVKPRIRELAEREFQRIRSDPSYRTPRSMLKRLSKSDVFFHIDPDKMDGYEELPVKNLGYLVTRYIAERFSGCRDDAIRESVKTVARALGIKGWKQWSRDEILGLQRLAPLVATFPDLRKWTAREKAALARLIRAKGAPRERQFVVLANRHSRFRKTVEDLAFGRITPRFAKP
jgi:hypothetical protein